DLSTAAYATENAQREVNRLLAERATSDLRAAATKTTRSRQAPASAPRPPMADTQPQAKLAAEPQLPAPVVQPAVAISTIAGGESDAASLVPAIQAGHYTPAVAEQVRKFYVSVAEIFEAWVRRRSSGHTQRAYRADVMSFVKFMEFVWPQDATRLLTVKITD